MLKTAPDQVANSPHAAVLHSLRHTPTRHPLELLGERAANRLAGCISTLIAGCYAPAMLMVERCPAGARYPAATWLVTIASPTTMRLEAMVDEDRLDLLAEGPPDRILARLAMLNRLGVARSIGSVPTPAGP